MEAAASTDDEAHRAGDVGRVQCAQIYIKGMFFWRVKNKGEAKMIGITALMGSALLFGSLILAGIARWVMEVVCTRQEAREMKAKKQRKERDERRAG